MPGDGQQTDPSNTPVPAGPTQSGGHSFRRRHPQHSVGISRQILDPLQRDHRHLRHHGIAQGLQALHPTGKPIISSTKDGLRYEGSPVRVERHCCTNTPGSLLLRAIRLKSTFSPASS